MKSKTFVVASMHCGHCKAAVTRELEGVPGVRVVDVDLETKRVSVRGEDLDFSALVSAIDKAGYEAEEVAA